MKIREDAALAAIADDIADIDNQVRLLRRRRQEAVDRGVDAGLNQLGWVIGETVVRNEGQMFILSSVAPAVDPAELNVFGRKCTKHGVLAKSGNTQRQLHGHVELVSDVRAFMTDEDRAAAMGIVADSTE